MQEKIPKPHNLILDNRNKLSLTGVDDVLGFNEETVSVNTSMGDLIIRGSKLHISKLNLETGEVEIDGKVNSLQYAETKTNKSFMQRLLG
ncbi:MAG: sporulation protein YabP [Ruminococcus sp.]|nr:sporulation protein YabP [Ruminococcus sp.]